MRRPSPAITQKSHTPSSIQIGPLPVARRGHAQSLGHSPKGRKDLQLGPPVIERHRPNGPTTFSPLAVQSVPREDTQQNTPTETPHAMRATIDQENQHSPESYGGCFNHHVPRACRPHPSVHPTHMALPCHESCIFISSSSRDRITG